MNTIVGVTLKGIFRDRVFQGILMAALVFLVIPTISSFSMRQVTEMSITLALSLNSFILLLLAVFLGGTLLWKDIERRYTYSVLGLPLARGRYLAGKFFGTALFFFLTALVLGAATFLVVVYTSAIYPPERDVAWGLLALCILFDAMKYTLLVAFAFFFSTLSTSFFLPVFGTIAIFLAGGVTQQVFDYIHSPAGEKLAPMAKQAASALYYILPNFSAFDLKVNAIYGLTPASSGLWLTVGYFLVYTVFVLAVAAMLFTRREMR